MHVYSVLLKSLRHIERSSAPGSLDPHRLPSAYPLGLASLCRRSRTRRPAIMRCVSAHPRARIAIAHEPQHERLRPALYGAQPPGARPPYLFVPRLLLGNVRCCPASVTARFNQPNVSQTAGEASEQLGQQCLNWGSVTKFGSPRRAIFECLP